MASFSGDVVNEKGDSVALPRESSVQCEALACKSCTGGRFLVDTNTGDGFCVDCKSKEIDNLEGLVEQVVKARMLVTKGKDDLLKNRRADAAKGLEAAHQIIKQIAYKGSALLIECQKELIACYDNLNKFPRAIELAVLQYELFEEIFPNELDSELSTLMTEFNELPSPAAGEDRKSPKNIELANTINALSFKIFKQLDLVASGAVQKKAKEERIRYCVMVASSDLDKKE